MAASPSTANATVAFPEAARTKASFNVSDYLHVGTEATRQALTAAQPPEKVLQLPTFQALASYDHDAFPTPAHREAGEYVDAIHDLFKEAGRMHAVGLKKTDSHDTGLQRIFLPEYTEPRKKILPLFEDPDYFSPHQKYLIESVSTAGVGLARFMNSQASLTEVRRLAAMDPEILKMVLAHGVHDIGGALGHENVESSLALDEPTGTRMLDALTALLGTAEELGLPADTPISPDVRQASYLGRRAGRLGIAAPEYGDNDLVVWSDFIGRLVIANLFKCDTSEEFAVPNAAYGRLPQVLTRAWAVPMATSLLFDMGEMPVMVGGMEYAPAFMRSWQSKTVEEIASVVGYFSQILTQVMTMPISETVAANLPLETLRDRAPYEINFYNFARWCADNPGSLGGRVAITYALSGNTMTPCPLNPQTLRGEKIYPLVPFEAYQSRNLRGIHYDQ